MDNSEAQDSVSSGGTRNWRAENSENTVFPKPKKGTVLMSQSGPANQWRASGRENRFFGERSASRQGENWRSSKFPEQAAPSRGTLTSNDNWKRVSSNQFNERKPPPKKHVTFDTTELLGKEPQEVVTFVVENLTDFTEFLAPPLPPNTVVELILIVEKVCLSKANVKFSTVILSRIHKNFMKQLEKYFLKLSLDEEDDKAHNELFWNDPDAFWDSLVGVLENITDGLQKSATLHLDKVIKACLVTILFHKNSHGVCVKEAISRKLGHLSKRLDSLKKISDQAQNQCVDNYQTMNVYPDPSEVLTREKPFVRQNIIDGRYMNVEHYLDTHFRLLREDFLAPLRQAICLYKDSLKNKEYVNITEFRIYTNARFTDNIWASEIDYSWIGNRVRRRTYKLLDPGGCTRKYVNNEEAFMPGSLLCFSSDNFESMFFGIATKLPGTRKGFVDVQLLEDVPFLNRKSYTMLECCNYFNTYYSVLKGLQNFNTYNFPMKKYIVDVVNDPQPPEYLTTSTRFTINDLEFTVLDFETWPSKQQLNLNEMQYSAFKQALTSKCAVIQGPPGTGKTHLGLKIAQTLVENNPRTPRVHGFRVFDDHYTSDDENSMDDDEDYIYRNSILNLRRLRLRSEHSYGPILVVAYTNHALDQFLDGLTPYTQNIVRIGHQSKNDKVFQFTFYGSKRDGDVLHDYYARIEETIIRKQKLMDELESVLSYGGIFNVVRFAAVISKLRNSALYNWSPKTIMRWLLGESSTDQDRQDRWDMAYEFENNFESRNTKVEVRPLPRDRNYILSLYNLKMLAEELQQKLDFKDVINMETMFEDWHYIEEFYKKIQDDVQYLEWRLQYAAQHVSLYASKPIDDTGDFLELPYNDRWILYFHWLDCYVQYLREALKRNNSALYRIWEELDDYKQRQDSALISNATVVGMTTSGAAKNRHLLENLNCRIVIVEEAAEVLESHIIVSLTRRCQHLILIGDHQQLRPSTADYQIEKQYQLGISLFERLVRNGICHSTLDIQHRMRPEISRLIVPAIYENLEDHASVLDFEDIKGIKHNVFFITHLHPEVEIGNSRTNPHEAKYLIALARHLILQGNDPSKITILSTYKGQMYEIIDEQKKHDFCPVKEVQVIVVDNFQGEENQIILLSLVRSNNQGSIGFLRVENRVCVALSRARRGFYMMGNMDILTSSSKIWPKVNDVLEKNKQIGPGLQLACQLHPQHVTTAVEPEDFLKVPDGGCHLPCNADLICGHICKRKCHVTDVDHEDYRCKESCVKILCLENHICPKECWKECGPCLVPMERTLPCAHQQMVPCAMKIEEYMCPVPVETLLKCKHTVDKPCCEDENKFQCPVEVEIIKPACGHFVRKKCSESVFNISCRTIVTTKLECGHDVEDRCDFKIYSYKNCNKLCLKTLKCGHICEERCHYPADEAHSTNKYRCKGKCTKLKMGCKNNHKCDGLCSEPCKRCHENININLPCGHPKTIPCCKSDGSYTCESSCGKIKLCGHICYGKCHQTCDATCFFKVFKHFPNCGHKINVNCSEDLQAKECMNCTNKKG